MQFDLANFQIDKEFGFLPRALPLKKLPSKYQTWDALAYDIPKLLAASRVRTAVSGMPELSTDELTTNELLERGMLVLSFLTHAYVWQGGEAPKVLPRALSVPLYAIAKKLGRPPILSYASYALHNFKVYDESAPRALGNIALLHNFFAGIDEEWFILIHIDIEGVAGPGVAALADAAMASIANDIPGVEKALQVLHTSLLGMNATMNRMTEWCDPYCYFHRVRPFIHGWKNNPALPDGLIYEGVDEFGGKPQQLRGETGSQSSIVPSVDAALQLSHSDDPLRAHLDEMKDYMPPKHRAYMAELEKHSKVRTLIESHKSTSPSVVELYNSCVTELEKFRSKHLEYAASYIARQSQKSPSNPSAIGTGGTPFMVYLQKHRDETASQKLIR